jgi:hypothetical protein
MTTSRGDRSLEGALWCAFYNAVPPDDFKHDLNAVVVVVVDSAALESKCVAWVRDNIECSLSTQDGN